MAQALEKAMAQGQAQAQEKALEAVGDTPPCTSCCCPPPNRQSHPRPIQRYSP